MCTYVQVKNAFSYFYPKRKVLEDGVSTIPLDISIVNSLLQIYFLSYIAFVCVVIGQTPHLYRITVFLATRPQKRLSGSYFYST